MEKREITAVINFIDSEYSEKKAYAKAYIYHPNHEVLRIQLIDFINKNKKNSVQRIVAQFYHEFIEYGDVVYMTNCETTSSDCEYHIKFDNTGGIKISYSEKIHYINYEDNR